jgi:hypothetical protein
MKGIWLSTFAVLLYVTISISMNRGMSSTFSYYCTEIRGIGGHYNLLMTATQQPSFMREDRTLSVRHDRGAKLSVTQITGFQR